MEIFNSIFHKPLLESNEPIKDSKTGIYFDLDEKFSEKESHFIREEIKKAKTYVDNSNYQ